MPMSALNRHVGVANDTDDRCNLSVASSGAGLTELRQIEDKMVTLAPGMAVTVEIKTGTRRIIEYLMSPLLRYRQESLRER
jgi:hypothetical protein